jgi:hypothetical protein
VPRLAPSPSRVAAVELSKRVVPSVDAGKLRKPASSRAGESGGDGRGAQTVRANVNREWWTPDVERGNSLECDSGRGIPGGLAGGNDGRQGQNDSATADPRRQCPRLKSVAEALRRRRGRAGALMRARRSGNIATAAIDRASGTGRVVLQSHERAVCGLERQQHCDQGSERQVMGSDSPHLVPLHDLG